MLTTPVRLRLSRAKGFNLQAHSRAVNGLEAVKVDRTTKLGNPFDFRRSEYCWAALSFGCRGDRAGRQEASVRAFRDWVDPPHGRHTLLFEEQPKLGNAKGEVALGPLIKAGEAPSRDDIRKTLSGKNASCWCELCPTHKATGKPLGVACTDCAPCHADVLLEIANR